MQSNRLERAKYTLIGCCFGDAMGMPTEGMSYQSIHQQYPNGITTFMESINADYTSRKFTAGSITDDSIHTILLIDAIKKGHGKVTSEGYMNELLAWYESSTIADQVIGPSTLNAIQQFKNGTPLDQLGKFAVTNGSLMKISPIGIIQDYRDKPTLIDAVISVCQMTHGSNVALSSAVVIAYLVSLYLRSDAKLEDLFLHTYEILQACEKIGFDFASPSLVERIKIAEKISESELSKEVKIKKIYDVIGTGVGCIETLPAVLAIVKISDADIYECGCICASIGGDTDTLGAIACAICGTIHPTLEQLYVETLERVNHIDFQQLINKLID
ncbi:MAG: ADP-ribosylglycohydrolase family protein [Lachnospiraceae bacterium]|nr:ADP-ribosylglycohydrolase family protein [Lachnospiraceae bacterium]